MVKIFLDAKLVEMYECKKSNIVAACSETLAVLLLMSIYFLTFA